MKKGTTKHAARGNKAHRARTTSITLDKARNRIARGEDRTDWTRVDTMTDADIERAIDSDSTAAPRLGVAFWKNAQLLVEAAEAPKSTITIRVDTDVLNKLKQQGNGYQSRINAVLRAYVAALRAS